MAYKLKDLLWSVMIFAGLVLIGYILGLRQREGIISVVWILYMLEWWLFGGLGLVLFILRKLRFVTKPPGLFYILCGVASFCNAAIGAYFLWTGAPNYPSTTLWLELGATACLAFLIFTDVFL